MSATAPQQAPTPLAGGTRLLAAFVGVATVALAAALVAGATAIFNVLVFTLFAVLWLCFAAALAVRPAALDELWAAYRRRGVVVQALGWLLLLPLVAGLLLWERRWHPALRLVLVLAIAVVNLSMFFPRG